MSTTLINLHDKSCLNQFDCIFNDRFKSITTNNEFIFTQDKPTHVCESDFVVYGLSEKYDLTIKSEFNKIISFSNIDYCKITKTLFLYRYDKYLQQYILWKQNKAKKPYFIPGGVCTLNRHLLNLPYEGVGNEKKSYVLKNNNGASNTGLIYIPKNRKHTLKEIIRSFKKVVDEMTNDSELVDFCNKFDLKLSDSLDNSKNPIFRQYRNVDFHLVEFNESSLRTDYYEFRLIANKSNNEIIICERLHLTDRSITSENVYETIDQFKIKYGPLLTTSMHKAIKFVMSDKFPQTFGSIDVWITNDSFGFYEFQTQFGYQYIPEDVIKSYLKRYIISTVNLIDDKEIINEI